MRRAAMKLYDLKTGTNTRSVRIFLAEKGVKLPTIEVDMMKDENKSPDYLSKNPMGTMPLLELDDGTQLAESVAICRYMEELHPERPLFGTNDGEKASQRRPLCIRLQGWCQRSGSRKSHSITSSARASRVGGRCIAANRAAVRQAGV